MIKPIKDNKEYKTKELSNGLKVLLISDIECEMSAAAINVKVGSWSDPYPGIAHFLEHMKFLSLDKDGNPNELDDYLSVMQGYSNAYTEAENTNYHFVVSNEGFEKGLELFR